MILVLGIVDEPVIAHFLDYLIKVDEEFLFIDERKLFKEIHIEFQIINNQQSGKLVFNSWEVDLKKISGIYNRLWLSQSQMDKSFPSIRQLYQAILSTNFFMNSFHGPVLNRPLAHLSNNFKITQYPYIVNCGFNVPATLVSNSAVHFEQVIKSSKRDWIIKSSGGIRSIVEKFTQQDLLALINSGSVPPHQFQELLVGYNVRVHVVGSKAIACKAETDVIDYRYASDGGGANLVPYKLPYQIEQKCIELSKSLSLDFSGIDLFHTKENEWFCFEVNPCPGYSWFEKGANLNISETIKNYLCFSS